MVPPLIHKKSVIDVGCGNRLLTTCMSVYAQVKGIDIDDDICSYTYPHTFDVVTCFDVLEHVEDLNKAKLNIYDLCRYGGLIIVNQPEQCDKSQPIDNQVELKDLEDLGKLIYLEHYQVGVNESYNFMVFRKV